MMKASRAQSCMRQNAVLKMFNSKYFFFLKRTMTRLSYYNVTTRLVDLVGLCRFKNNNGKNKGTLQGGPVDLT